MGIFQKYLKHYIQQRNNLKSKLTSLQISCNEKSRKIGTKLCKFLDNVICKRQLQVEGNSSINEKDRFSTPLMVEQQLFPSLISDSETGDGHGSITPTYVCEICVEPKPLDISFNIKGLKYIKSKLDDNVSRIQCPVTDCEGVLDPDFCREILPRDLFNRWGKALCESALCGNAFCYNCGAKSNKATHFCTKCYH
ncbi:hypothetical protein GOBAR_DD04072 [Gossypium barbadense]|nr:hypothetical protein GOBAR_DD04072 [Gossypium barbadense]